MKTSSGFLWGMAFLLAGCAQTPVPTPQAARVSASHLVLLADADGHVGQAIVRTAAGETELSRAGEATRLGGPTGQVFVASSADIDRVFGPALAASPVPPKTFLLYFMVGGAQLVQESELLVEIIRREVQGRHTADLSVIGHTDTVGDGAANERLGLERARFVAQRLSTAQPDNLSISVESHGETNLLVKTPDNTPEPKNRRVEVTVR